MTENMHRRVRQLNVGSLNGLFYEFYDPDPNQLRIVNPLEQRQDAMFLNVNGLFWSEILKPDSIASLLDMVVSAYNPYVSAPIYEAAIYVDRNAFENRIARAIANICEQDSDGKTFFEHLETLSIVCRLYSQYVFAPFELKLHEGFIEHTISSVDLIKNCFKPAGNPCFKFLQQRIFPVLKEYDPECIWLNGRLNLANMAIAVYLRNQNPEAKIIWVCEGSEYYATNKISKYLCENKPLFSIIDAIVLDDYAATRKKVIDAFETGLNLDHVDNLIWARRHDYKIEIHQTQYRQVERTQAMAIDRRSTDNTDRFRCPPGSIANIHMFPGEMCFWRKCTFCGINKKYHTIPQKDYFGAYDLSEQTNKLLELEEQGLRFFWLTDEAIPAALLAQLADRLSVAESKLIWQARSRMSKSFSDPALVQRLAKGGLRELRLGLESVAPRIIRLMNKYDCPPEIEDIESIIRCCHHAGIRVHCPCIIGFPTETKDERHYTYSFLRNMHQRYASFSFNINILGLDVASPLFSQADRFGIQVRFPCPTNYFLGNLVEWECEAQSVDRLALEQERDDQMRELLYPWMRMGTIVKPHVFYRLMETSRNTLTFRTPPHQEVVYTTAESRIQWNRAVIPIRHCEAVKHFSLASNGYIIYNGNNHCAIHIADEEYQLFVEPITVAVAQQKLMALDKYNSEDIVHSLLHELLASELLEALE